MKVFYFGTDTTWANIKSKGQFNRRNACLLSALAQNGKVRQVYAVHRSVPEKLPGRIIKQVFGKNKIKDIFLCFPYPDHWPLANHINSLFALLLWLLQLGYLPSGEDIAWCYWPKGYLLFKRSGARGRLIFDTDHNIVSDPNIPSHLKSERIRLLKEIGQRAEIILSSSRTMIEWYNKLGVRETVLLMNGVDPSRFNNVRATTLDIPTPVIGYVGSLSRWVLYEWLVALAKEQPDWNFIIIGRPVSDDQYKELELFPNVYFLGPKTYQEVPSFMKSFDIALGLYRPHPALDVNSMKLYEYIAAGVPVVSSN